MIVCKSDDDDGAHVKMDPALVSLSALENTRRSQHQPPQSIMPMALDDDPASRKGVGGGGVGE